MGDQPTALRIADRCQGLSEMADAYSEEAYREAAAELRRLHEVEQQRNELLEALRQIAKISNQPYGTGYEEIDEAREIARAAIAKAEGEK